jgi:hypothetical protein
LDLGEGAPQIVAVPRKVVVDIFPYRFEDIVGLEGRSARARKWALKGIKLRRAALQDVPSVLAVAVCCQVCSLVLKAALQAKKAALQARYAALQARNAALLARCDTVRRLPSRVPATFSLPVASMSGARADN